MHGTAIGDCCVDRLGEHLVGIQVAIFNGFGDAREVLVNDTPGTQVHMADFGVAHLAVG